ncbi:phosphatase PAP2 family protein [Proteiniphilum sp.]|uniref:phosphatase PAP2 family protein n=1 Tax=Proteiniphilum sp. TaxID=1926877 RepID=UPI002B21E771|nr:phosphatase PAP2 family protein [Proteiniphilum sp.]MEA4916893.1 phosphatase PAP2 family protein [Proteiniphilum sp.]
MNTHVIQNYARLKPGLFFLPLFLIMAIVFFLYSRHALNVDEYIRIQEESFFSINHYLGQYTYLESNLTQFGDGLVFLALLSMLVLYAPKLWESLASSMLVSVIFSASLKKIFAVPRPAAVLDNDSFFIIGRRLAGYSSLPSGHAITIFLVLTVLLFAFMPRGLNYKILWSSFIVITGLILASSRVGVGAHYPLDVVSGSIIGYISGLLGIFISRKYKIWGWFDDKKYYPFFIVLFLVGCVILVFKIMNANLVVYYLSFISLIISLYKIIQIYVRSFKKSPKETIQ